MIMITRLKYLNRILILINIGLPLIYLILLIKFNALISYTILLIYVSLPILFIVKNKIDEQELLKYELQIKEVLNTQIVFTIILIISVIMIRFTGKTVSDHSYEGVFVIIFILLLDIITWNIYQNKLFKLGEIINPKVENYTDDGKGEIT